MTRTDFLRELAGSLEIAEGRLDETTVLTALDEYDSLSVLAIIALIDESFGISLTGPQLTQITTVGSLMDLIGRERFD
jgi:acyl carrier protein